MVRVCVLPRSAPHPPPSPTPSPSLFPLPFSCPCLRRLPPITHFADCIAFYYNPQVKVKLKDGVLQRRVRGTQCSNITVYTGDRSALTADMQMFKLLCNAVVSEGADFMNADISDFISVSIWSVLSSCGSPAPKSLTMFVLATAIDSLAHQHTMDRIVKGQFGLPEAGRLAANKLTTLLLKHGYYKAPHTACLFRHHTLDIAFCLVVDDFAIKYKSRAAAEHLFFWKNRV